MKKVLMVCLGNICRSPIAEAVFQDTVKKAGEESDWDVDSAAIGDWHVGKPPDWRALKIMKNHGLDYKNSARQIVEEDFEAFDFIFGMDHSNIVELKQMAPRNSKAKILLLGDFGLDESDKIIKDPYYDSHDKGFEKCYQQCSVASAAFLKAVKENRI